MRITKKCYKINYIKPVSRNDFTSQKYLNSLLEITGLLFNQVSYRVNEFKPFKGERNDASVENT